MKVSPARAGVDPEKMTSGSRAEAFIGPRPFYKWKCSFHKNPYF